MPVPLPPALAPFLALLRCPSCRARLRSEAGALRCPAGHTFDLARHGYVSLLTGARATSGDDPGMARARDRFLSTGAYEPLRAALTRQVAAVVPDCGTLLDAGGGTGYYLAGILDHLPGARGLVLDTSVRALRSAARSHSRAAAAACDVFRPFPLADGAADAVLNVFAPRNAAEFHRVLRPAGRLLVARPTAHHLTELRDLAPLTVDPAKEERLHHALSPYFTPAGTEPLHHTLALTPDQAQDLLHMTPAARHLSDTPAAAPLPARVTFSVRVTAYRPRRR